MKKPIRLIIAIPNALFRLGMISYLREHSDMEVISAVSDGTELVAQAKAMRPDLVVMEMNLGNLHGLEAMRSIKDALPDIRIVILTGHQEHMIDAINNGVHGYLPKGVDPNVLLETLKGVSRGEIHIAGSADHIRLTGSAQTRSSVDQQKAGSLPRAPQSARYSLSPRQQEVLRHLSTGITNKEIAMSLGISENTVKNHIKGILSKLHVQNRSQALALALSAGMVTSPKWTRDPD